MEKSKEASQTLLSGV